ncbi:uncharacterized protein LTHEOB_9327 [Lasiodiplodia theobromae]|uniref:uncharacterized protein n=1 Tax=Lasiodiplodia theobromae TaxID=45133 RepID=UPI0015C35322|nr:uncharacterized protein LTHEOB_9327 [Lasiodiplodia theobromae]KAF4540231.1 hypothetical protein LTHEOB_9327 [Lasiodiplodia theobromae]
MPPPVPTQPRANNMYPLPPLGYQQPGYSFDSTPAHLQQQFPLAAPVQTYAPPNFQTPTTGQAARPSATYRVAEPDEEEDLSGPLSLAGLRDVTFTQPAAGGSGTPSTTTDPSLDLSKHSPPKPWLADTRKDSHARFDLRLDDLEKGMIVHLKPNATWGTGRHPGLVIDWKDAGYVEILVGTSFLGQGMRSKMARIRETHEKVRIAREYLKIWDRTNVDHEPTYQSLDLPVLRLREGKYLKKTTYFRFVYRFHCELSDICKYGDGVSLQNKYVLDDQSLEALYAYLNLRLPMIKEAEATVRRKQRAEAREAAKQKVQDEMKKKVAEAARALQARTP